MKSVLFSTWFITSIQFVQAGLEWREFADVSQSSAKIRVDDAEIRISTREVNGAPFKEDHLKLEFSRKGSSTHSHWFSSSYGTGAVAIEGRLLFLRYGTGRGTFAREEHVRVFLLGHSGELEEMADVKISTFVNSPENKNPDPVCAEYTIQTRKEKSSTTITFIPPSLSGVSFPKKTLTIGTEP